MADVTRITQQEIEEEGFFLLTEEQKATLFHMNFDLVFVPDEDTGTVEVNVEYHYHFRPCSRMIKTRPVHIM